MMTITQFKSLQLENSYTINECYQVKEYASWCMYM